MMEYNFEQFVDELDAAQKAHFTWTYRVLRCAVLHSLPGEDALREDTHLRCSFGRFLIEQEALFIAIDEDKTYDLIYQHKTMHDAIRKIFQCICAGAPGREEDLDEFEKAQQGLLDHLAYFKTQALYCTTPTDALTKLPLRQRLDLDFKARSSSLPADKSLVVMLVDVDRFKWVNDQYGHNIGDQLLQHLISIITPMLRANDKIYRYGGEEFVILMHPEHENDTCFNAAERIREIVALAPITIANGISIPLTITIGCAKVMPDETLRSAIDRADKAMYQGKVSGRNCCIEAPTPH